MDSRTVVDSVNLDSDSDESPNANVTPNVTPASKMDEVEPSSKRKRRSASIWDDFEVITQADGSERAMCVHCKVKSYVIGSSSHGTSNLNRHIAKCPAKNINSVDQMHISHSASLRKKKIDQMVYREKMAISIMLHNYPFLMVEHEGTRNVHQYLNEDVKPYSRNTAKADCMKIYNREFTNLKAKLGCVPSRICLTSDLWTSITTEGYFCLTAHYVNESWELKSKILNFSCFPPPHRGDLMAEKMMKVLKEWGIEKKIFSLTLDNASNNNVMKESVMNQLCLQNSLLRGGQYFHVRCCAHILNIIVQEGLKVSHNSISKIRESVKYVKGSEARKIQFVKCASEVGVAITCGLRIDIPTRWNSTYEMLNSAIKYRKVFCQLQFSDPMYSSCPTPDEWERGERMCKFLKPFADITTLFSGLDYPTSNLYMRNVWKIHIRLLEEMENQDDVISMMASQMKPKFDKYWDSYCVILSMAVILDPRYKVYFVEFCFKRIDESSCDNKVKVVEREMHSLFQEYVSKMSKETPQESHKTREVCANDEDIDEFDYYESSIGSSPKSELDLYLEEPRFDRHQWKDLDILKFWRDNQTRYPILSLMARDILTIPITTVASESSFSMGNRVLTKYRSSLNPETAQAVICGRNWLYGYESNGTLYGFMSFSLLLLANLFIYFSALGGGEYGPEDLLLDFSKFTINNEGSFL